jgi:hypothetical protein
MMKRLFVVMILLGSALVSHAQDLITTRSGEDIQAKVLEVSPLVIKYKKYSNLDGPTYSMNTAQVLMIRYENGDKDIFDGVPTNAANVEGSIPESLKYRELKHIYDPKLYFRQYDDRYSPGWLGVASFFIPGLGQAIEGEWWRATGIFAGSVVLSALTSYNMDYYYYQNDFGSNSINYEWSTASVIFGLANLGLEIWNICDAVRIAKVKNMYYQDLKAQRGLADLEVKLEPFVASVPSPSFQGFSPSAGLSFKVSF